jgi:multiple sugar transport system substrate-binding protein
MGAGAMRAARAAALLMALAMLFAGCQGGGGATATTAAATTAATTAAAAEATTTAAAAESTTAAAAAAAEATTAAAETTAAPAPAADGFDENGYWTGEVAQLTLMTAAGGGAKMNERHETRVHQELIKKTGVDMVWEDVTAEKLNLLMASGDLKDIVSTGLALDKDKEALFKSGQVITLDELIAQYAPDMQRDMAKSLEISRNSFGLGDGKIYQIPVMIGEVEREDYPLYIRWEWYKEIGAPEFSTYREYLDILKQIVDLHPTTDDGKKVFGIGGWANWGPNWWMFAPEFGYLPGWSGFGFAAGTPAYINYGDNSMIMAWDEQSPEWMQLEIANYASRLGIYDPDSLLQSNEDFNGKRDAGQYVNLFGTWVIRRFNAEHAEEGNGYMPAIPTGGLYYGSGHQRNDVGSLCFLISKNCADPAAAMRWINYVCSYEGCEMLYNGVEGIDWEIGDNGKPQLTEQFLSERAAGVSGDVTGIGFDNFFSAFQRVAIDPKYGMPTRWVEDREVAAQINTKLEADYSSFYGALSVNDRFEKAFESGDLKSMRNLNINATTFIPVQPTEIARTTQELQDLKYQWWNKLFAAKDDADFESIKQQAIADYKAQFDLDALEAWTREAWAECQAKAAG